METTVAVVGLKEAVRALRVVNAKKVTTTVNKEVAEMIGGKARDSWRAQPSPRTKSSMANRVIGISGRQTEASLTLRTRKYPWAAGGEFGSHQFRQFRRWTGNRFTLGPGETSGYHILPAIRDNVDKAMERYGDRLLEEFRKEIDRV